MRLIRRLFLRAWPYYLAMQTFAISAYSEEKKTSAQEALLIRRIAEYWKEGQFATAKKQILDFLGKYEQSSCKDHLLAMLGDLYYREEDFTQAANVYVQITDKEFREKIYPNLIQSYFELKNYPAVVKYSSSYLKEGMHKETTHVRFLSAEAMFRQIPDITDAEQKLDCAKKAKSLYQGLGKTKYEDFSLLPLAELHRILGENPEAAQLYVLLASKHPEKREELLFRAANLQLKFKKEDAAATYGKIAALKEKRAPLAAYNHLILLFEGKQYKELLTAKEEMVPLLSPENLSSAQFCIASSYYALENWKDAAVSFELALKDQKDPVKAKKILLSLVNCAQKTHDLPLFGRTLEKLRSSLSNDPAYPQSLVLHAQMCLEAQEYTLAKNSLEELMQRSSDEQVGPNLLYDYGFLLYHHKNWAEAKKTFTAFLNTFSSDELAPQAWRFLVNCSLQEMKGAQPEAMAEKRQSLIEDLQVALSQKTVFSTDEERDYRMSLIKMLFESENYKEASTQLKDYLADYKDHPSLVDAHLLMAACNEKLSQDKKTYIYHVEKALVLNPELPGQKNLHLNLYNAYLNLVLIHEDEKENYLNEAAEHLYQAFYPEGKDVKEENSLWLANYYYARAIKNSDDCLARDRAVIIYEKLLNPTRTTQENYFLQLAELLAMQNQLAKKTALLESLSDTQKKSPDLPWKYQRQVLFELAKTYEGLSENEKALNTYEFLIDSSARATSYISYASLLQKARLQYSLLSPDKKNADSPELLGILNDLKDLQIRKKLASEPTHLEAALDYAEIQSSLEPEALRSDRFLFLLRRIKEDFNSKEYQESKIRYPEKDVVAQTYLQFIDAEIVRLEALKTNAKEMEGQALSQLQAIQRSEGLTPYLQNHIKRSLEALENTQ